MSNVSEHIERLIVRKLDGELTQEESLVLDRELLRCPEARELLEEYARIDAQAGAMIQGWIDRSSKNEVAVLHASAAPNVAPTRKRTPHPHRWMWWVSAAAACLALVVFIQTPQEAKQPPVARDFSPKPSGSIKAPIPRVGNPGGEVGVFNAADMAPQPLKRVTDRNWYLVPNRKGGPMFMFSVDHIRELERPRDEVNDRRHLDPV